MLKYLVIATEDRAESKGLVAETRTSSIAAAQIWASKSRAIGSVSDKSWFQQANKVSVYNGRQECVAKFELQEIERFGQLWLEWIKVA